MKIKEKVKASQLNAAVSVNQELIRLYWEIGRSIQLRQEQEGWGLKTIEILSKDLQSYFPNMKGFSYRNLKCMVQFAKEYPDFLIGQQLVAQLPWGHNLLLISKIKDYCIRSWYIKKTIENRWSRSVLLQCIKNQLHKKQGKCITNFIHTLTPMQSDLAQETLKDPYNFDFLTISDNFNERELENELLKHIEKFLIELGQGFAFMGRQYRIVVENDPYYLDLLFYHVRLHCYIVVELKADSFDPRDIGQINFYLSAVDDILRSPQDNPSIGLLLCKDKKGLKVEYALRDIKKPIGVAEYETQIINSLPKKFIGSLPTIEEIEKELEIQNTSENE